MRDVLSKMKVAELKKEVSKTNIKGYSKMKKSELIDLMVKNKDKFSHLNPKKHKKKPPLKNFKIVGEKKPKAKKLTMKEVEDSDAFDKSKYKDFYFDLVSDFIDGKGSTEKQLDRADAKAYSFVLRQTKKLAKKEKVTSVEELVDAINKLPFRKFTDM